MVGADPRGATPGLGTAAMDGLMLIGSAPRMTTGTASEVEDFLPYGGICCWHAKAPLGLGEVASGARGLRSIDSNHHMRADRPVRNSRIRCRLKAPMQPRCGP